jgi:putative ABC transport system permease protein
MAEINPPKWALKFLRWYCRSEYLPEIEGDLLELFHLRSLSSKRSANLFFVWNVFRSFRFINLKETQTNNWTMNLFKNYTKIYFRRFRKETPHYLVNIFGLGLGFTILFYILMFVYDEQNIDKFHSKKDRVYRVVTEITEEDGKHDYLSTPGPLADALKQEFPVIEETAHITYTGSQVLAVGENRFADREWAIATNRIFNILDFEIVSGDPMKSINGPAGVVLTEDLAIRLFGRVDVVGEVLDESNFGNVEVIAIMKEMPRNSTYRFNNIYVVDDYDQWSERFRRLINSWDGRFAQTLTLFKEGTNPSDIEDLKKSFIAKFIPENRRDEFGFYFQKYADIHLGSSGIETGGMNPRLSIPYSNGEFVAMIMMMGLLVIFIAALNYVNLSSVQALKRTLEASMRKINGANNKHLIIQLFYETLLTILLAYAVALILITLFFPYFLQVSNKDFNLNLLYSIDLIPYHVLALSSIWFISAMLPALYYSKLKRSLLILKNAFSGKGDLLRKGLVGVQYTLSIFLMESKPTPT